MKPTSNSKPYWEMTTKELQEATAEFDREFIIDTFRPMTPRELAIWERMKRRVGRPRRGNGAKVISVSIERDLLKRTDVLARKMGVSRARVIERGLRSVLVSEESANVGPRRTKGRQRDKGAHATLPALASRSAP
jgi:hypothetical protein